MNRLYTGHTQKNGAVSKVSLLKPHHTFVYALYVPRAIKFEKIVIFPTECLYVFGIILTIVAIISQNIINSLPVVMDTDCLLCGRN